MTYNFLIAPDFSPERFAGWHMFNTLLQKRADIAVHLVTPASHSEQEQILNKEMVSVIYANPFDAARLIREKGYRAIARPIGKANEMVIASAANSEIKTLDDVKKGQTVAMADNQDVFLIGMRLLEAVDIADGDLLVDVTETYQAAARHVIQGKADIAFFISEIYHGLSKLTKSQLNVLIESDLAEISHIVLVKSDFERASDVEQVILSLQNDAEGQAVLNELGFTQGFKPMSEEEAEFMIDLMETLLD